MKNLSLMLLAIIALNSPMVSAADKKNCESSDPLLKSENIECFPENDYLKISNPMYTFAGNDYEILLNDPVISHDICKKFGAERAQTYNFHKIFSYFKNGYDMKNNKIAKKAGNLAPVESITCKFSKIMTKKMNTEEGKYVAIGDAFILVANGKDRDVGHENEKAADVADKFCRQGGFLGAIEYTTKVAATTQVKLSLWSKGYNLYKLDFYGRNAVEIGSSGELKKVMLQTDVHENLLQTEVSVSHPLILEKVTCYYDGPRE